MQSDDYAERHQQRPAKGGKGRARDGDEEDGAESFGQEDHGRTFTTGSTTALIVLPHVQSRHSATPPLPS